MVITYSTYEAKARFSEVIRHVRDGKTVTVSYRGEPVAEIRPLERPTTIEQRTQELERRGSWSALANRGSHSREASTWPAPWRRSSKSATDEHRLC